MLKKLITLALILCLASAAIAKDLNSVVYDPNTKTARLEIGDANNQVVIGNSDAKTEFQANVKMTFWGEDDIQLYEEGIKGTPTLEDGKLKLDLSTRSVEWRKSGNSLKWIITLKEKPASNKYSFKFGGNWRDFDFCYQTPLTELYPDDITYFMKNGEEWVDASNLRSRPVKVEGSYAVYHKTKRHHIVGQMNYKTGKVLHIFTPKATDANSKSVWCKLHIEAGIYKVTIPQSFLDTAVYPVVINDTLGWQVAGGTDWSADANVLLVVYIGTMPAAGTLDSIHLDDNDASAVDNSYVGLYSAANGTIDTPATRIRKSPERTFAGAVWHVDTASSEALGNGLEIYVALATKNNSEWKPTYDEPIASFWRGNLVATYDIPSPAPGAWSGEDTDERYAAYITYTPSAAAGGQVIFINSSMGYGFGGFGLILVWVAIQKLRGKK